jgi:NAD(P)-dependent dehydrogenase (short-subunit alcohol dehydrogenase family)
MSYWHDKVVLVTGSSAGFGKVLAESFLRAGSRVVVTARAAGRVACVVDELRQIRDSVSGVAADVTRLDDVRVVLQHVMERHQRLDALINNVGRSDRGLVIDTSPDRYRDQWETNFLSALLCTQAAWPHLLQSRGHVVFMGSLASKAAAPYLGTYAASKFPLAALAQQLRLESAASGVHVLLVCPGPIARDDEGRRYDQLAANLPEVARRPGGGVKVSGIQPEKLAQKIMLACQRRVPELVVPSKARLLFAIAQFCPSLGDWLLRRYAGS